MWEEVRECRIYRTDRPFADADAGKFVVVAVVEGEVSLSEVSFSFSIDFLSSSFLLLWEQKKLLLFGSTAVCREIKNLGKTYMFIKEYVFIFIISASTLH